MPEAKQPGWKRKWAIGIYSGPSPLALAAPALQPQPVFTAAQVLGVRADSVADPFLLHREGAWHLFFELWNSEAGRGEIGHSTSADGFTWTPGQVVLREPFHLSYPCVFEWEGETYLIPESRQSNGIRLYRAEFFPVRWSLVRVLVEGPFADPTAFYHEGFWWMFAQRGLDELRLFGSARPDGEWREHPASPLLTGNRRITRPGGSVIRYGERLLRFAQDGLPTYGYGVRALEIHTLTATAYRETEIPEGPILRASGHGWNGLGMHHLDAHPVAGGSWLAAVDGATLDFY